MFNPTTYPGLTWSFKNMRTRRTTTISSNTSIELLMGDEYWVEFGAVSPQWWFKVIPNTLVVKTFGEVRPATSYKAGYYIQDTESEYSRLTSCTTKPTTLSDSIFYNATITDMPYVETTHPWTGCIFGVYMLLPDLPETPTSISLDCTWDD